MDSTFRWKQLLKFEGQKMNLAKTKPLKLREMSLNEDRNRVKLAIDQMLHNPCNWSNKNYFSRRKPELVHKNTMPKPVPIKQTQSLAKINSMGNIRKKSHIDNLLDSPLKCIRQMRTVFRLNKELLFPRRVIKKRSRIFRKHEETSMNSSFTDNIIKTYIKDLKN